jgi:hypothetical protein
MNMENAFRSQKTNETRYKILRDTYQYRLSTKALFYYLFSLYQIALLTFYGGIEKVSTKFKRQCNVLIYKLFNYQDKTTKSNLYVT